MPHIFLEKSVVKLDLYKRDNTITLYSTGCPRCRILKDLLDEKGINHQYVNDEKEIMGLGVKSVPILKIENTAGEFELLDFVRAMPFVNQWGKQ